MEINKLNRILKTEPRKNSSYKMTILRNLFPPDEMGVETLYFYYNFSFFSSELVNY